MDSDFSDDDMISLGSDDETGSDDIPSSSKVKPTSGPITMIELTQIKNENDRKGVEYNAGGQWIILVRLQQKW